MCNSSCYLLLDGYNKTVDLTCYMLSVRLRSRSKVKVECLVHIRGSVCHMHQWAITLKFGVKGGQYQSEDFVCLSVIIVACADDLADMVDRLIMEAVNKFLFYLFNN